MLSYLKTVGHQIPTTTFNDSIYKIRNTLNRSHEFYHLTCCGGNESDQVPFKVFAEGLLKSSEKAINQELKEKKFEFLIPIVVLLIVGFLVETISFTQLFVKEKYIKLVSNFLLHCNPYVVFLSPKIMLLLSGDFSSQPGDSLTNKNEFFDNVFLSLPDAIIYANSEMIIQNVNIACKYTFGDAESIGKSITNFFFSEKFSGNVSNLFTLVDSNPTEEIIYRYNSSCNINDCWWKICYKLKKCSTITSLQHTYL